MSLPVPNLDDLDFDKLIEQARGLIPRFAPQWTDHNLHDPGMTLLDLVAWLVDQNIYQAGFVSDEHFQAFAALLGVQEELAVPAEGLLWPIAAALLDKPSAVGTDLDKGAKVVCLQQPDISFELAANVHISLARPLTIQGKITRALQPGDTEFPTVDRQIPRDSIEVLFDRPLVEQVMLPGEHAVESPSVHPVAIGFELEDLLPAVLPVVQREKREQEKLFGHLVVDYRLDLAGAPWRRARVIADSTRALSESGLVLVNILPEPLREVEKIRVHVRITTRRRANPLSPRLLRLAVNVLPIIQWQRQPVGVFPATSTGLPDQRFLLPGFSPSDFSLRGVGLTTEPSRPLITIAVEENGRLQTWQPVDDLLEQGPDARVFFFHKQRGEILFGNGLNGAIPPLGAQIQHSDYVLTEGAAGNLAKGLSWSVAGAPLRSDEGAGEQTAFASNPEALRGGRAATNLNQLQVAARTRALQRQVALTNSELLDVAQSFKDLGVARAHIIDHYFPLLPAHKTPGARTVVITPARAQTDDPFKPVSIHLLHAVQMQLSAHRVLGERLSVIASVAVRVRVKADLLIDDTADSAALMDLANKRLQARLLDIPIAGSDLQPWPVGRAVSKEEIKTLLALVPGVIAVAQCQLARGCDAFQPQTIVLDAAEIAVGGTHHITARALSEQRKLVND